MYAVIYKKDLKFLNANTISKNPSLIDIMQKIGTIDSRKAVSEPWNNLICVNIDEEEAKKIVCEDRLSDIERSLANFCEKYKEFIGRNLENHYKHFEIPKRSGGVREIYSPDEELRFVHHDLEDILRGRCNCMAHPRAFAYEKHTGIQVVGKLFSESSNRIHFSFDFKNFFGSLNPRFVENSLLSQVPFALLSEDGKRHLRMALSTCFLFNGLPQGSSISPFLSNIVMIPFDYKISGWCNFVKGFSYFRYADDIHICGGDWNVKRSDVKEFLSAIIRTNRELESPLRLNFKKTKAQVRGDANWVLGQMIDHRGIRTVGHDNYCKAKAIVWNLTNNWTQINSAELNRAIGLLSFYNSINRRQVEAAFNKTIDKVDKDKKYIARMLSRRCGVGYVH